MRQLLDDLLAGTDLSAAAADELLVTLTGGEVDPAMAGALLIALRAKGETPDEVRGFAAAMRRLSSDPGIDSSEAVDVVGTGGDRSGSLNLSTGAALLTAAGGVPVVKHGNRSMTSQSGSADILEAIGLPIPLDADQARRCFETLGFTFLFAPHYHPAMAAVGPIRRALGVRTVFNMLGPLTNPAGPRHLVVGAFDARAAELMAVALSGLEIERAFVLHGAAGWDEPSPIGEFLLYDVRPGSVVRTSRDPADLGMDRCDPSTLAGGDPAHNAGKLTAVFAGETGPHRDSIILGAALALEVTGWAPDPGTAVAMAESALDDGRAMALLKALAAFGARERS
ncbi:MAG TPA: anthranilate phosphoribosyltransferase [Acidimicrobiia bacterium]|nr:anthranilate phosphoribosyltransferase [Acidimicrobiia bacterium]